MVKMELKIENGVPFPFGATALAKGINFAIFAKNVESIVLCLFYEDAQDPFYKVSLDSSQHKTGDIWHLLVKELPERFAYAYEVQLKGQTNPHLIVDPYAKNIVSDPLWHHSSRKDATYKPLGKFTSHTFDWEGIFSPRIPQKDLIIYEMHVRGLTIHPSSKVQAPGTFKAIIEKIPYFLDLGINALEFMPIQEFPEEDVMQMNPDTQEKLHNYFGYAPLNFFSLMNRYASQSKGDAALLEFQALIKELHRNGIEIILDMVFNHTCEGNQEGPILSFKGLDPKTYYFLSDENLYLNFSGCGNTLNANQPVTRELIIAVLRYWVSEFHIDGFRFDLASTLTRGFDGGALDNPPLIESLSKDPILSQVKLIAEPWDAGGLYQIGKFASFEGRWSEWNGQFQSIVRNFIKGAPGYKKAFSGALCGSHLIYPHSPYNSINYITAHDGFSLADLVSYNEKHNLANGENNQDGLNSQDSWNCGIEGETDNIEVLQLRKKQMRNFHLALMVSRGTPMLLMGDEYQHSRKGNNNPWCQDNEINWFLWDKLEKQNDFFSYYRFLIHFRKAHPLLRPEGHLSEQEIQWHGYHIHQPEWDNDNRLVAFSLHFQDGKPGLYIAFNASDKDQSVSPPSLEEGIHWQWIVNTNDSQGFFDASRKEFLKEEFLTLAPYSSIVIQPTA